MSPVTEIVWNNDGTAIVTATSTFSGEERTRTMRMTKAQYNVWIHTNTIIQMALPQLSANDREFLTSGITQEEWDKMFKTQES